MWRNTGMAKVSWWKSWVMTSGCLWSLWHSRKYQNNTVGLEGPESLALTHDYMRTIGRMELMLPGFTGPDLGRMELLMLPGFTSPNLAGEFRVWWEPSGTITVW